MTLNFTALGLCAINFFLRLGQSDLAVLPLPYLLLSVVGVGIFLVSGYLGGTMVYDNGIGVGRHRRYTRTTRKTIDVSILVRHDGWVPVCDQDELKDGETLRVKCNGDIIAIAKQNGEVYAWLLWADMHQKRVMMGLSTMAILALVIARIISKGKG